MTPEELSGRLRERMGEDAEVDTDSSPPTAGVSPEVWVQALEFARDDLGCGFFDWLSAVDDLDEGFAVLAHLWSPQQRHHLLVCTRVPRDEARLPTATPVFRGANWHERETREMFGIEFTGHPHPELLLLPDGFEGHPLRKDFVLASRVAKQWPGVVDPGQSASEVPHRHRRKLPPGVPAPDEWGPDATTGQGGPTSGDADSEEDGGHGGHPG